MGVSSTRAILFADDFHLAAFAESGWTAPEKKSYPDFRKRLKKIEAIWKEKGYIKTQIGKY